MEWWQSGAGGEGTMGELLFNRYRVSVMQDGKSSGNWSHNRVTMWKTSELHTSNG